MCVGVRARLCDSGVGVVRRGAAQVPACALASVCGCVRVGVNVCVCVCVSVCLCDRSCARVKVVSVRCGVCPCVRVRACGRAFLRKCSLRAVDHVVRAAWMQSGLAVASSRLR